MRTLMTQFARMSANAPNFDRIVADDLTDNARLVELYVQAVRRRLWGSTERDFIEFVNRVSKALHDDSQKNAGKTIPVADRTPVAWQHFTDLRKPNDLLDSTQQARYYAARESPPSTDEPCSAGC